MAGFLYHFPGRPHQITQAERAKLPGGLEAVFRGRALMHAENVPGPTGNNGIMVSLDHPCAKSGEFCAAQGYHADRQQWVDCGAFWLGWWNAAPPGPEDLQREKDFLVDGWFVRLRPEAYPDQRWIVPVLGPAGTKLPHTYKLNGSGEYQKKVRSDYLALFDWAGRVSAEWDSQPDVQTAESERAWEAFHDREFPPLTVAVLGVNYHVGPYECSAMELLSSTSMITTLYAALGRKVDEEGKAPAVT